MGFNMTFRHLAIKKTKTKRLTEVNLQTYNGSIYKTNKTYKS